MKLGTGVALISIVDGEEMLFSEHFACVHCEISIGEIAPRTFSFNSPHGACPACTGLGFKLEIDPNLIMPDKELSIAQGGIKPYQTQYWYFYRLEDIAREHGFSLNTPIKNLTKEQLNLILYGENFERSKYRTRFGQVREHTEGWEGVIPRMERLYRETESEYSRAETERYMVTKPCLECQGKRLKPEALAVTIGGKNIIDVSGLPVSQTLTWVTASTVAVTPSSPNGNNSSPDKLSKKFNPGSAFLSDIGLDYLSLERPAATLSGGEAQRIRLATQIGSGLMGVLYICDEPTVGLHLADSHRLIETLKRLKDIGNTILVVEHDESVMRTADYIIDMGPRAGEHGGRVIATGTIQDIMDCKESLTGQYLSGAKQIPMPIKTTQRQWRGAAYQRRASE